MVDNLASMSDDRYPELLFHQDWVFKPHRGRQRKVCDRIVYALFVDLILDTSEGIKKGESSLRPFLDFVGENVKLESKIKLSLYITCLIKVEFKKYLHGLSDAGSKLLFKVKSGMNGSNEELSRHRGREDKK